MRSKGNINVFDLCLQIFDAGRLTDTQAALQTFVDDHHLTSNVGSADEAGGGLRPQGRTTDRDAMRRAALLPPSSPTASIVSSISIADGGTAEPHRSPGGGSRAGADWDRRAGWRRTRAGGLPGAAAGYSLTFAARPLSRGERRSCCVAGDRVRARGERAGAPAAAAAGSGAGVAAGAVGGAATPRPQRPRRRRWPDGPKSCWQLADGTRRRAGRASRAGEWARPDFWDDRERAQASSTRCIARRHPGAGPTGRLRHGNRERRRWRVGGPSDRDHRTRPGRVEERLDELKSGGMSASRRCRERTNPKTRS
jgi:hypothetical protein